MKKLIFRGDGSVNSARPIGCARGTITVVAVASLVDGETFVITDGYGVAWTFEFDVNGTGVTAGRIRVNVSTDTSASDVRDRTITAINAATKTVGGESKTLTVQAWSGGTAIVNVRATVPGSDWNQTITEAVANGSFAVTGLTGAIGDSVDWAASKAILIPKQNPFESGQEDRGVIELFSYVGSGTMTVPGLVIWGRSRHTGEFHPLGVGDTNSRGRLNAANALEEIGSDDIHHMEVIANLSQCDAIYVQPTASFGGTATAIDVYLASML